MISGTSPETHTYPYSDKFLEETGSPFFCVQKTNHVFRGIENKLMRKTKGPENILVFSLLNNKIQ